MAGAPRDDHACHAFVGFSAYDRNRVGLTIRAGFAVSVAQSYEKYRAHILPSQLDLARRKYRALVAEAKRRGRADLLELGE